MRMRLQVTTALLGIALLCGTARADLPADARDAYAQGHWQDAADLYKKLVQQDPSPDNLWHLGRAELGLGQDAAARDVLQQSLAQAPG